MVQGRKTKKQSGSNNNSKPQKPPEELQAIILAQFESENFLPISKTSPKILLPIANVPAINYTLELLQSGGVKEVIIAIPKKHIHSVESYIKTLSFTNNHVFEFRFIPIARTDSPCEILRQIEKMDIIRSDPFILVSSLVVSNINLREAIDAHYDLYRKNRHNFMTCLAKKYPKGHRMLKRTGEKLSLVTSPLPRPTPVKKRTPTQTPSHLERILSVLESPQNDLSGGLDVNALRKFKEIHVSAFYLDCCVDICSPAVLCLCQDNFDFWHLRKHLLKSALESEIESFFAHLFIVPEDQYFGAVRNWKSFGDVAKDVVSGWAYPITSPKGLLGGKLQRFGRSFRHASAVVDGSATINPGCIIGKNCRVGPGAVLTDSMLCDNCVVGENSHVTNVHCFCGVSIGADCVLQYAVLGSRAKIGRKTVIEAGSVIADNAKVSNESEISKFSLVAAEGGSFRAESGKRSDRFKVVSESMALSEDVEECLRTLADCLDFQSKNVTEEEETEMANSGDVKVFEEVEEMLKNAETNGSDIDMTCVEITSLKLCKDIEDSKFYFKCVFRSLLQSINTSPKATERVEKLSKNLLSRMDAILRKWQKLFRVFGVSDEEQKNMLFALEESCVENSQLLSFFPHCLSVLYDLEVVSEEVIFEWWDNRKVWVEKRLRERAESLSKASGIFIEWLKGDDYDDYD